jgi:hypothetical protein
MLSSFFIPLLIIQNPLVLWTMSVLHFFALGSKELSFRTSGLLYQSSIRTSNVSYYAAVHDCTLAKVRLLPP